MRHISWIAAVLLPWLSCPKMQAQNQDQAQIESKEGGASRGMVTKSFEGLGAVLRELRTESPSCRLGGQTDASSPSPPGTKTPQILSAREVLQEWGVPFPTGASASWDPFTGVATITNTAENIALIDTLASSTSGHHQMSYVAQLRIIQAPSTTMRAMIAQTAGQRDASAVLVGLLEQCSNPGSNVSVIGEAYLNAVAGETAVSRQVYESHLPSGFAVTHQGQLEAGQETLESGIILQVTITPHDDVRAGGAAITFQPDSLCLNLAGSLQINPTPPSRLNQRLTKDGGAKVLLLPHPAIPTFQHEINTSVPGGGTALVGIGTPSLVARDAPEGVLWASFVTVHPVPVPTSHPLRKAVIGRQARTVPPGMRQVAFQVPSGMLENAMMGDPSLMSFLERHGVPSLDGAQAELAGQALVVINSPANIERIATLIQDLESQLTHATALTYYTVRGEGAYLRDLASRGAPLSDHSGLWTEIQEGVAANRHGLTVTDTLRIETKPDDTESSVDVGREHLFIESLASKDGNAVEATLKKRDAGSSVEARIQDSGVHDLVQIGLTLEHHLDLPKHRTFGDSLPPVTEFKCARSATSLLIQPARPRLISLTRAEGPLGRDTLEATFALVEVIPLVQMSQLVSARAPDVPAHSGPTDEEFYTREFRVPPDRISLNSSAEGSSGAPLNNAADQGIPPAKQLHRTVQQVLEQEAGVEFPPGAWARSGNRTSSIIVRNTQRNLDKAESYIRRLAADTQMPTGLTTYLFEVPTARAHALLAGLGSKADHRQELDDVLKAVDQKQARSLATSYTVARSGQIVLHVQGVRQAHVSGIFWNDKGELQLSQDTRLVGLRQEAEISRQPEDGGLPSLILRTEFHTSPPDMQTIAFEDGKGHKADLELADFNVMKLATEMYFQEGATRLAAVWKTAFSKSDTLQIMFITCDILQPGKSPRGSHAPRK